MRARLRTCRRCGYADEWDQAVCSECGHSPKSGCPSLSLTELGAVWLSALALGAAAVFLVWCLMAATPTRADARHVELYRTVSGIMLAATVANCGVMAFGLVKAWNGAEVPKVLGGAFLVSVLLLLALVIGMGMFAR